MVFFNLNPSNKLTAGPQSWYFAAIAIPLTAAVFVVWILWKRQRTKAIDKDMKTKSRLQDIDVEKSGGLYEETRPPRGTSRSTKMKEETVPLRQMNHL
jgi:hypothetical protein